MLPQIIFYIAIYIIGVVLGSFFTLATYRIPLKQDILYTRSYCPKCNNKLKAWDLIPILSYISLKGKCRYCHEKISPRYIIIEFFSGLFYLLFVLSLKIDIFNIDVFTIVELLYGTLIISSFFIIGGIEKETKKLSKGTIIFGLIVNAMYMIYLYILGNNIYRYIIYLVAVLLLILISKKESTPLMFAIAIFSLILVNNSIGLIISAILSIINIIIYYLFTSNKHMHPVFNICITNVIILIMTNLIS